MPIEVQAVGDDSVKTDPLDQPATNTTSPKRRMQKRLAAGQALPSGVG